MVGIVGGELDAVGHTRVLIRGRRDAALAEPQRQADLRHGQGIVPRSRSRLHGRYTLGASRATPERYVQFIWFIVGIDKNENKFS